MYACTCDLCQACIKLAVQCLCLSEDDCTSPEKMGVCLLENGHSQLDNTEQLCDA